MALSLSKAAPLKPSIQLAQALSEYEAILSDNQKAKLRIYRGQKPPAPADVMRFTAEIDRDMYRNRKSRRCFGPRLTNVLQAVQQFSTVVDVFIGGAQSMVASGIWGVLKVSIQVTSAYPLHFEKLSNLFMIIGGSCPRYQDFELLYPDSPRLQQALSGYYVVIVQLCRQAVLFLNKSFLEQISSSVINTFESVFGGFKQTLERLANDIRDEVSLAASQAQNNDAKKNSAFLSLKAKEDKTLRLRKALSKFLNACSLYNHHTAWKQARKRGNTNWIFCNEAYKQWKKGTASSTIWCTGILGSGKTVLSANVIDELMSTVPTAVVSYFFCRYDETESLKTRTIIGSIARQILSNAKLEVTDKVTELETDILDTDQLMDHFQELLPLSSGAYFIVIDGLDECEEKEAKSVLMFLNRLLMSRHVFHIYCSSRPAVFRWAASLLQPQWNVSMSEASPDIKEYVVDALTQCLESNRLRLGDPKMIITIQDALVENAHGMFLWVAFQIDSICLQKTDETILVALKNLPKDLPETFDRVLRRIRRSEVADLQLARKIFQAVTSARRPLTLEELREAVSIEPSETTWNSKKVINDMLRSLDCCGSLLVVDEEHLTVHFAHHSVKQYLLSKNINLDVREYQVDLGEAEIYMSEIIVTYLNFGIFSTQLTKASAVSVAKVPLSIVEKSLPKSSIAKNLALKLLRSRPDADSNIRRSLVDIIDESKKQSEEHSFLSYAQEFWIHHIHSFDLSKEGRINFLWKRLISGEVDTVKLSWNSIEQLGQNEHYIRWMFENKHRHLLNNVLNNCLERRTLAHTELWLSLMQEFPSMFEIQSKNIDSLLCPALLHGHSRVVRYLLKKGTDVNVESDQFLEALIVAIREDNGEMIEIFLEEISDDNAKDFFGGISLFFAVAKEKGEIVRLLLRKNTEVDARNWQLGVALLVAVIYASKEMVQILLEGGADANLTMGKLDTIISDGRFNTIMQKSVLNAAHIAWIDFDSYEGSQSALHTAVYRNYQEIARLLLCHGADVNAQDNYLKTTVDIAILSDNDQMLELLLEFGADVMKSEKFNNCCVQHKNMLPRSLQKSQS